MDRWLTTLSLGVLALGATRLAPHLGSAVAPAPTPAVPIEAPPPSEAEAPVEDLFLAFDVPSTPRRLPQHPTCAQPPPGGIDQYTVIDAARSLRCGASLHAVQAAMAKSIDHCTLAKPAWDCFGEADQAPLAQQRFRSFAELATWLPHLEGTRAEHQAQLTAFPELARVPAVYHPATGGLEARLDAYGSDPLLQDTVADLIGTPTIADDLTVDLLLEAQIAVAIADVPPIERTPAMEQVWARRVYVLASALRGDVGAVVHRHRRDDFAHLQELLAEAIDGDLPAAVSEALAVARGDLPLPTLP